jgi:hypothetical protein
MKDKDGDSNKPPNFRDDKLQFARLRMGRFIATCLQGKDSNLDPSKRSKNAECHFSDLRKG